MLLLFAPHIKRVCAKTSGSGDQPRLVTHRQPGAGSIISCLAFVSFQKYKGSSKTSTSTGGCKHSDRHAVFWRPTELFEY